MSKPKRPENAFNMYVSHRTYHPKVFSIRWNICKDKLFYKNKQTFRKKKLKFFMKYP
jgi:hypothetical protein